MMNNFSEQPFGPGETPDAQLQRTTAELQRCRKDAEEFRVELSRDLRTGLNCILGFAELLEMRSSGVDRDNVQQILKAGRELLALADPKLAGVGADSSRTNQNDALKQHGCDVLYVEDSDANFTLVQHILAARPEVTLHRAECGQTAVALAFEQQPRLIFLDLNLPDIHGSEVLHLLRQRQETAKIPVVVISADALPTQIERLLAAGARDYLTKPFRIELVLAIVDEVLKETSSNAATT
jgi:CheY-like chemotaxis protein